MDTLILILLFLALIGFAFDGLLALAMLAIAAVVAVLSMTTGGLHWLSNLWDRLRRWWDSLGRWDQWEL